MNTASFEDIHTWPADGSDVARRFWHEADVNSTSPDAVDDAACTIGVNSAQKQEDVRRSHGCKTRLLIGEPELT